MAEQTKEKTFKLDPSPKLRNEYGQNDFLAKEVHYHQSCKSRFTFKMKIPSRIDDDGTQGLNEKR